MLRWVASTRLTVQLTADTSGEVLADAVQLVRDAGRAVTNLTMESFPANSRGNLLVSYTSHCTRPRGRPGGGVHSMSYQDDNGGMHVFTPAGSQADSVTVIEFHPDAVEWNRPLSVVSVLSVATLFSSQGTYLKLSPELNRRSGTVCRQETSNSS
jgi:hypothetical protein